MAQKLKQHVTREEIEQLSKALKERAESLRSVARALEHSETASVEVMGKVMAERGIEQIDGFLFACKRAAKVM